MADPLALLGYQPQQPLPALSARPPALNYLGGNGMQQAYDYNTQYRLAQQSAPAVTSTGLPDIEILERNMAQGFTEQLKARQAQARAAQEVIGAISTLNPRSNDYLTQRNSLLQKAPWALQSKDVNNILTIQEEAHKEHAGEIKNLGEFSDKYHAEYQNLKKSGKNDLDASEMAMASAVTAKRRVEFLKQGAPREVVDKVFKKDGTFDIEAMAEWEGGQKRLEREDRLGRSSALRIPEHLKLQQAFEDYELESVEANPSESEKKKVFTAKEGRAPESEEDWKVAYSLYNENRKRTAERDLMKQLDPYLKTNRDVSDYLPPGMTMESLKGQGNVPQFAANDPYAGASTQPQAVAAVPSERSTETTVPPAASASAFIQRITKKP